MPMFLKAYTGPARDFATVSSFIMNATVNAEGSVELPITFPANYGGEVTFVATDSAGLGNDAEVRLSSEQIAWATHLFVMEKTHRNKLAKQYKRHLNGKHIICLDIPDDYDYMQPELVTLLEKKAGAFLRS